MAHVLVVDDHASIRLLIKMALNERGHTCDEAADGGEALELLGSNQYDLLVLDLMMPTVDGLAVLEQLGQWNGRQPPKIAVLTAKSGRDVASEAIEAGAAIVLTKPFDPDILADSVEKLIEEGSSG